MRRVLAAGLLALTCATGWSAAAASTAWAGWAKPRTIAPAGRQDDGPPTLAVAPSGAATAAFTTLNADRPGSASAWLVTRAASGASAPRKVSGAAQVLGLAYRGSSLRALLGSSAAEENCCSAAATATVTAGGAVGRVTSLAGGLAGATAGRLIALGGGRMLAAVATERGVWAAQTGTSGSFAAARLISLAGQQPVLVDAAWLGGARSLIAWSAGTGVAGSLSPRTIDVTDGTAAGGPRRARVAITVPRGHRVDDLALARRGGRATIVWTESFTDRHGFHSRVEAADLTGAHPRVRALSPAGRLASGLSAAGDPSGDQGVTWKACTVDGDCVVQAAGRGAGHPFGSARTLGSADATTEPSLAISPTGQVLVGWERGGHPVGSIGFGRPTTLSATTAAAHIDVAYGTRRQALAAWVQGTVTPSIASAAYRSG